MNNLNTLSINIKIKLILTKPKYLVTFLIGTLFFYNAKAQTDFRNGYYITLENDTVFGLLDYRGEVKNSQTCVFKNDDSTEPQKFNPGEIQSYRFTDGKFYVSKKVETDLVERTVFLEFLVDGITNLYFLRDINNYKYFLEDKNGKFLELSNETIIEKVDGKGEIQRKSNRYIGVLHASFADCKEIQQQINNVNLGHKSLINITKNYHNYVCDTEECIVYEKKVQPAKVRFAPVVKTGVAGFHFDKGIFANYDIDPDFYFGAGMIMSTVFPGINEKISFEVEIDVNQYNFHGSYEEQNASIKETYNLYLDLFSIQPTLSAKYTFPTGKVKPTVAVGAYADIFAGINEKIVTEKQHQDTVYTYESYETPITPMVFGGFLQFGCNYELSERTFFTNLRLCYSTNQDQGIKSIIQSVNLNIGMYLDKRKKK
jgi:hypothetical protein